VCCGASRRLRLDEQLHAAAIGDAVTAQDAFKAMLRDDVAPMLRREGLVGLARTTSCEMPAATSA
jgi:hypothetical protein